MPPRKRLDPSNPSEGNEPGLWARSWALPGGRGYGVRINVGDVHWTMGRDNALAYAAAFVAAATAAEHDTAVYRLLIDRLGLAEPIAAQVIVDDLRPDRPDGHEATRPIRLAPAVGHKGPFISMSLDGARAGDLTPADAREHGLAVLDALAAGDLDSTLRAALVGQFGLDEPRASAVIASLPEHWPTRQPSRGEQAAQ